VVDDFIEGTYGVTLSDETYKRFYDTFVGLYNEIDLEDENNSDYFSNFIREEWVRLYPEIYRYQNGDVHLERMDLDFAEHVEILKEIKRNT
tara:strand:- start:592 stop:864 length:273 start_codon:yes stop_codon:yes gene_type:complete